MKGAITLIAAIVLAIPAAGKASSMTVMDRRSVDAVIAPCIARAAAHRPWLEKTLWGIYDQEQGWAGAEIPNRNGSYDLGPLQINSVWVPLIGKRLHRRERDVYGWLRDSPCFNVSVGAWLFLSNYRNARAFWTAVGEYHSLTQWRARAYASRVAKHLNKRFGEQVFTSDSAHSPRASYIP